MPFRHKSVDVFNYYDTVVDEHSERENERKEYHEVECHAHQTQNGERQKHGERNGHTHEKCVAQAKPEHDDEHYEHNTEEDVVLQIAHLHARETRLVVRDGKCKVGG